MERIAHSHVWLTDVVTKIRHCKICGVRRTVESSKWSRWARTGDATTAQRREQSLRARRAHVARQGQQRLDLS